jgi:Uma2 family endonuclease
MGIPRIDTGPMTVEEFYAFTDGRPDDEKWELIEGVPVLNASPSPLHQGIAANIIVALTNQARAKAAAWTVIPGIGVRASDISRPEPDVMILPKKFVTRDPGHRDTENALVLFEVMSPSTSSRDLKWKRITYTGIPSLTHYVVIAQDKVDVAVFAREDGFIERRLTAVTDTIEFRQLGVTLSVADIYHDLDLT